MFATDKPKDTGSVLVVKGWREPVTDSGYDVSFGQGKEVTKIFQNQMEVVTEYTKNHWTAHLKE